MEKFRLKIRAGETFLYRRGGIRGLHLQMMAVGGTLTVDVLQSFPEGLYVDALLAEAARLGLKPIGCDGPIEYTTPKDKTTDSSLQKRFDSFLRRHKLR